MKRVWNSTMRRALWSSSTEKEEAGFVKWCWAAREVLLTSVTMKTRRARYLATANCPATASSTLAPVDTVQCNHLRTNGLASVSGNVLDVCLPYMPHMLRVQRTSRTPETLATIKGALCIGDTRVSQRRRYRRIGRLWITICRDERSLSVLSRQDTSKGATLRASWSK
jgi:hypothetical protein